MNQVAVAKAVRARLIADTGTGGLRNAVTPLVADVYTFDAGPEQAENFPLLVVSINAWEAERGFAQECYRVLIDLSVFAPKDFATENGLVRASSIIDRIYGNAPDASWTPTYGLNRHSLVLTGDWVGSPMEHVRSVPNNGLDYYGFVESYQTLVSRTPPTGPP